MITLDNYEIYFADFMADALSPEEVREVEAFLLLHSDLCSNLHEAKSIILPKENITFAHKDKLKKGEIDEYLDYYAIATVEDVMTNEERAIIDNNGENASFKKNVEIYKNIKLTPDTSIHFEHKNKLYKNGGSRIPIMQITAYAAGLLLLAGISILYFQSPTEQFSDERILPLVQQTTAEQIIPSPSSPKTKIINNKTPKKITPPTPAAKLAVIEFKKTEIITAMPLAIAKVEWKESLLPETEIQQQLSVLSRPEIMLTEEAEMWKPSTIDNFQSNNIFSTVIHLGKDLAAKIKNREFPNEFRKSK